MKGTNLPGIMDLGSMKRFEKGPSRRALELFKRNEKDDSLSQLIAELRDQKFCIDECERLLRKQY